MCLFVVYFTMCCVWVVSDFIILPGYVDFTANEVVSVFTWCYSVVIHQLNAVYNIRRCLFLLLAMEIQAVSQNH